MSSTTIFTHSHMFPGWISLLSGLLFLARFSCDTKYQVRTHFSKVFKREKYYRLYLHQNYDQGKTRYRVIYFFNGWGGRCKSDELTGLDGYTLTSVIETGNDAQQTCHRMNWKL